MASHLNYIYYGIFSRRQLIKSDFVRLVANIFNDQKEMLNNEAEEHGEKIGQTVRRIIGKYFQYRHVIARAIVQDDLEKTKKTLEKYRLSDTGGGDKDWIRN